MTELSLGHVGQVFVLHEYTPPRLREFHRVRAKTYQPDTHAQWIKEHLKTREWDAWAADYFFKYEQDAVMFALVWA